MNPAPPQPAKQAQIPTKSESEKTKLKQKKIILGRVRALDKLLFTKHLAVMIKSGISLAEALDIILKQTKSAKLKQILTGVIKSIENGQTLNKSLAKYPKVFDQFYLSLISVGEESGTLEKSLNYLAQQLEKDYNLRKKIQAALLYPGMVFFATIIMGGFISLFVLPKLVDFFAAFEIKLPLTTQILLGLATLMKNFGILIFTGLGVLGILSSLAVKLPQIKPIWDRWVLKIPLFGKLINDGQLARFARNFGVLMKSGVPISQSLETTAKTLGNLKFQKDLLSLNQSLQSGKNIGDSLEKANFSEFPALVSKMVSVGEKTGKLDDSLTYLGDFFEAEVDHVSKNLTTILEPFLLLTIGLIVGFVALAIISPIYQLTGSIRR